ncbi:unnamed protein product, partial [Protopolystoma xenopodis]
AWSPVALASAAAASAATATAAASTTVASSPAIGTTNSTLRLAVTDLSLSMAAAATANNGVAMAATARRRPADLLDGQIPTLINWPEVGPSKSAFRSPDTDDTKSLGCSSLPGTAASHSRFTPSSDTRSVRTAGLLGVQASELVYSGLLCQTSHPEETEHLDQITPTYTRGFSLQSQSQAYPALQPAQYPSLPSSHAHLLGQQHMHQQGPNYLQHQRTQNHQNPHSQLLPGSKRLHLSSMCAPSFEGKVESNFVASRPGEEGCKRLGCAEMDRLGQGRLPPGEVSRISNQFGQYYLRYLKHHSARASPLTVSKYNLNFLSKYKAR